MSVRHLIQSDIPSIVTAASQGLDSLRSGTGPPSNGLGTDGDWYIDTAAGFLYGPKAGGVWPGGGIQLATSTGAAAYAPAYIYYDAVNLVYPVRPNITAPVWWVGPATPAAGGTAAKDNVDFWIKTV